MPSNVTRFLNTTATTARATQVPAASFTNTCNSAASNSPGIGITAPLTNLVANEPWSLLDQFAAARTPQVGQVIGGNGFTARNGNVTTTWDTSQALYSVAGASSSGGVSGNGTGQSQFIVGITNPPNANSTASNSFPDPAYPAPTVLGSASLATLAAGWTTP